MAFMKPYTIEGYDKLAMKQCSMQKILPVFCTAGNHRADSAAKAAAMVLNSVGQNVGYRFFNCKVFSLSCMNITSDMIESTIVTEAAKWLTKTWTTTPTVSWGYETAQQSERAFFTYGYLSDLSKILSCDTPTDGLDESTRMPMVGNVSDDDDADPPSPVSEARKTQNPYPHPKMMAPFCEISIGLVNLNVGTIQRTSDFPIPFTKGNFIISFP